MRPQLSQIDFVKGEKKQLSHQQRYMYTHILFSFIFQPNGSPQRRCSPPSSVVLRAGPDQQCTAEFCLSLMLVISIGEDNTRAEQRKATTPSNEGLQGCSFFAQSALFNDPQTLKQKPRQQLSVQPRARRPALPNSPLAHHPYTGR